MKTASSLTKKRNRCNNMVNGPCLHATKPILGTGGEKKNYIIYIVLKVGSGSFKSGSSPVVARPHAVVIISPLRGGGVGGGA